MSLGAFGPVVFAAGLAALAAALFLLQRLRVRHRAVRVPTILFWREAVEETRARVLVRRFRHPWAYALVFGCAALLWLAAAAPLAAGDPEVEHLLLLDGSAAMTRGERFATAVAEVRARAAGLPRVSTRVMLAGSRPLTLLAPGEELGLLARRLEGRGPEACPSTLSDALRAAAALRAPGRRLEAEIHGDGALAEEWMEALPAGTRVARVAPEPAPSGDAGLVALGFAESAAGHWDELDIYARVAGGSAAPDFALDGASIAGEAVAPGEWVLRSVPARAQRLRVELPGGALAAAERRLPDREPLRVAVSPRLPAAAHAALAADDGLRFDQAGAQVALRLAGEPIAPGVPALVLVDPKEAPAFLVRGPVASDAESEVRRLFERLGLREVDAVGLAEAAGRPIELRFEEDTERSIEVWAPLFGPDYDFALAPAFPLFLAAAVRWLAGAPDLRADAAAGARIAADSGPLSDVGGLPLDGAGAEFRLPRAGAWTDARGDAYDAALLDPALFDADASSTFRDAEPARGTAADPRIWIALLALALLACEWTLHRRGRIP